MAPFRIIVELVVPADNAQDAENQISDVLQSPFVASWDTTEEEI